MGGILILHLEIWAEKKEKQSTVALLRMNGDRKERTCTHDSMCVERQIERGTELFDHLAVLWYTYVLYIHTKVRTIKTKFVESTNYETIMKNRDRNRIN